MKTENILILAALGFGAFYISKRSTGGRYTGPTNARPGQQQQMQAGSLIAQGLGAVASLFGGKGAGAQDRPAGYVNALTNFSQPGQAGAGWQYYDNGTAINPQGEYFYGGEKVWSPDAVAVNPPNSYAMPYSDLGF